MPPPTCDADIVARYLERRATIPLFERDDEALATIIASCGKREELFMIHDWHGILNCGAVEPEQRDRIRKLACPSPPCVRHSALEGAYDREVADPPSCQMALLAALESLGVGPAAVLLARDAAIVERWLEWARLFEGSSEFAHPRELRRLSALAYPSVHSLHEPAKPDQTLRLHRDDDVPAIWILEGADGRAANVSWSRLGTPPDVKFETKLAGERALDELISGDVDLLVDDDVPWRVVRTVLEQLAAVRPEATLGLVVRGDADDPALVRVSVSPARHADSKTRKMSCDGAYERVQSAVEFNFAGELSFADVARIVDCVCTSQDCSDGFSLHYWRPSTSAGKETDQ